MDKFPEHCKPCIVIDLSVLLEHALKPGFVLFVWFDSLRLSQQLWSSWDGQFTLPHFFPRQA